MSRLKSAVLPDFGDNDLALEPIKKVSMLMNIYITYTAIGGGMSEKGNEEVEGKWKVVWE